MKNKLENLFNWPKEKPNLEPDNHHYFGGGNLQVLNQLIDTIKPKYILEMGSWTGAGSTKFILDKAPDCHLVCIDHWASDLETHLTQNAINSNQDWLKNAINENGERIKTLWEVFLVNLWDYKNRITPIRKHTIDGLNLIKELEIPFDLIYIDAHHDYDSVLHDIVVSIENWPNATICGDDYKWPDGGVQKAVIECASKYGFNINVIDQCWYYSK